ncbi:MAG: hypothetical protein IPN83_00055 [Holophagales bacterium]|nr:hypothetical protein [Holophagales bacterium]
MGLDPVLGTPLKHELLSVEGAVNQAREVDAERGELHQLRDGAAGGEAADCARCVGLPAMREAGP